MRRNRDIRMMGIAWSTVKPLHFVVENPPKTLITPVTLRVTIALLGSQVFCKLIIISLCLIYS